MLMQSMAKASSLLIDLSMYVDTTWVPIEVSRDGFLYNGVQLFAVHLSFTIKVYAFVISGFFLDYHSGFYISSCSTLVPRTTHRSSRHRVSYPIRFLGC